MPRRFAHHTRSLVPLFLLCCIPAASSPASESFVGQIRYDQVTALSTPGAGSELEQIFNTLDAQFAGGGSLTVDFSGELKRDEFALQPPVIGNQAIYVTDPTTVNSIDYSFEVGGNTYDFGNVPPLAPPGAILLDGFVVDRAVLAYGLGALDGDIVGGGLNIDIELPPSTLNPENLDQGLPDILTIYEDRPSVLVGDFATKSLFDNTGGQIILSGTLTNIEIQPSEGIPGDFNDDGVVNGLDYLEWQQGNSPSPGSQSDLELWRMNYGMTSQSAASSAVPEPSTSVLLMFAAITYVSRCGVGSTLRNHVCTNKAA